VRTLSARLEQLEGRAQAAPPVANPVGELLQIGLTEREVEVYCHLADLAREETPEARQAYAVVLADPPRMKKVLGILASLPEAVVKGLTLEELLAQAGHAAGLTMAEVLARPDGAAILAAVADDFFADREEADHTQAPEALPAATGSHRAR
jgi:hypothetical protein